MKEWKNKVEKRRPGGSVAFITLKTGLRTIFKIISGFFIALKGSNKDSIVCKVLSL